MKNKLELSDSKHELDKIREYESLGYTAVFNMKAGKLSDVSTKKSYSPEDVNIIEKYRYEGMSNPNDQSILFALETCDGIKGLILRPYGAKATDEIDFFLTSLLTKSTE